MSKKPLYLSKGRFKLGSECPRKLFYEHHKRKYANQKKEDPFLMALAEGGHQVGTLAQHYYAGGVEVESLDYDESVEQTNRLLERANVTIYEAAIRHENYFIRVDVLVKEGDHVQLVEVKAKSYGGEDAWLTKKGFATSESWPYLDDIAFQTWVVEQARPHWKVDPFLMMVDKRPVTTVDGLHQLFRIKRTDDGRVNVEITEPVDADRLGREILAAIPVRQYVDRIVAGTMRDPNKTPDWQLATLSDRAQMFERLYCTGERVAPPVGTICKKCEYRNSAETAAAGMKSGFDECWREHWGETYGADVPLVTDLWNFRGADKYLNNGVWRMADVPAGDLKPVQATQHRVTLSPVESEWVSPLLRDELGSWRYPLHFLDFETIAPAIPFHRQMHPYESLGFQFSCHHVDRDGTTTHDQFIAEDQGQYPCYAFLTALKAILDKDDGTVLRYSPHENTILRHLRRNLVSGRPELPDGFDMAAMIAFIDEITQATGGEPTHTGARTMVDMYPLVQNHYYHRRMGSKKSIKAVLDAMMSTSATLKERYSRPLEFGTNLKGMVMHQVDSATGETRDPYELLPPVFEGLNLDDLQSMEFFTENEDLRDGGAAMMAYARMQFTEMGELERKQAIDALLRYCELDTLAMVMVWQGWRSSTE